MAGLQYNFFPTDFFYPRTAPQAANKPVVLPLQTTKLDHVAASSSKLWPFNAAEFKPSRLPNLPRCMVELYARI
ncbi:unnamed protein product [Prunus armeniaca]|uniref:Uncharacterized protein n=1 Tax=Prunus armeniaca TaxID=36596 RepID=A0A6J5XX66_PRUAR|nr:unnamed protein product [Prunus armeniaca]